MSWRTWSGTSSNATWSDFWLNEGFTVYFGAGSWRRPRPQLPEMLALLGRQDLEATVRSCRRETRMFLDPPIDPDEAATNCRTEGYFLPRLGREPWARAVGCVPARLLDRHVSVDDDGRIHGRVEERIRRHRRESMDHGPGIPDNAPIVHWMHSRRWKNRWRRSSGDGGREARDEELADARWIHFSAICRRASPSRR
jgi:hypothetical protein